MDREDLVFATCYQLAQLIAEDWEDQPEAVSMAIDMLKPIDWPGEVFWGVAPTVNPLELTPTEKEPDSIRKKRRLYETKIVCQCFKVIMKHADHWETKFSDDLKKEIISRIDEFTKDIQNISRPVPFVSNITL
jgi:arylamine N-acetyltransferase